MSKPMLFKIRLLQACRFGDRLHLAGSVLDLPSETAAMLVHKRHAVLDDPADMALLLDYTKANGRPWASPKTR
jgi:hypothetical protein